MKFLKLKESFILVNKIKDYLNQLRKKRYLLHYAVLYYVGTVIIIIIIAITTIVIINTLHLFNSDVSQVSVLAVNFAQLPLAKFHQL